MSPIQFNLRVSSHLWTEGTMSFLKMFGMFTFNKNKFNKSISGYEILWYNYGLTISRQNYT